MSIKTRVVLLALAAVSVGVAVALDRWNRQLEAAVALPRGGRVHPSIPGSLPAYVDEVTEISPDLLDLIEGPVGETSRRYWLGEWS